MKLLDKDILKENIISKEVVETYAKKYELCPFEFSLYISEYSDIIVGDYNYVFDPQVRLIRYFEEDKNVGGVVDLSEGPKLRYNANFGPKDLNFDIKIINPY